MEWLVLQFGDVGSGTEGWQIAPRVTEAGRSGRNGTAASDRGAVAWLGHVQRL